MTPPWIPRPGGRKMGDPSPLTGVQQSSSCGSPSDLPWDGRVCVGLWSPLIGALGADRGWTHCCPQEPRAQAPILSFRHKLQPDGSLVISPLRAEDAGTYSCGGTRPGADSQKIQLQITGLCPTPPSVGSHGPQGGRDWLGGPGLGCPHTVGGGGARVLPWAKASL